MDASVRYIIMTPTGFPIFATSGDEPAVYKTYKAAEKAAKGAAEDEPGKSFFIFEHVTEVKVPSGEAEVYRRYPDEHYK